MDDQCRNVGELMVGGKVVGLIRCGEPAGHEVPSPVYYDTHGAEVTYTGGVDPGDPTATPIRYDVTPHRAVLEWAVEGEGVSLIDWPEANDPNERFDVEVPIDDEG